MDTQQWDEQPRRRPRALALGGAVVLVALVGVLLRPGASDPQADGLPGRIQTGLEPTPEITPTRDGAADPPEPAPVEPTLSAFEPAARWQPLPNAPFDPDARGPAVWDGRRMVLWPGQGHGGMYAPGVDAWAALPPAPAQRSGGWSATWSGEEVLYWGGRDEDGQPTADGIALTPAAALWRPIPEAPIAPRTEHGAVWGDGRLWVFGGADKVGNPLGDGAVYDPATDAWEALPTAPLSPRTNPTLLWTGDGLLVWGGLDGQEGQRQTAGLSDGALYRPGGGWEAIGDAPVPLRRTSAVVWTGEDCNSTQACRRLLVWGRPAESLSERDGYAYEPSSATWTPLPLLLTTTRSDALAHWAQDKAIVFGGRDQFDRVDRQDGFVFDPATSNWRQIPAVPLDVGPRPAVVWTGSELLVWGNGNGARYNIPADLLHNEPLPWSRQLPIESAAPAGGD